MDLSKLGRGFWGFIARTINRELGEAIEQYKALAPLIDSVIAGMEEGEGEIVLRFKYHGEEDVILEISDVHDPGEMFDVVAMIDLADLIKRRSHGPGAE